MLNNRYIRSLTLMTFLLVIMLVPATAQDGTFSLQILHSSDNESSFQDPNTLEPKILNYGTVLEGLREVAPEGNSLYLTAGDHTLPSPFFEAASQVESLGAPGLADIAFFNAMGLTANGIGNHEFDDGLDSFAVMLANAEYPFLAVNLDFSEAQVSEGVPAITIAEPGQNVADIVGQVSQSAFVEVGGERIGLIGRAPADFFNVIEDPDTTIPGVEFVGGRTDDNQPAESAIPMVLEQVELLTSMGINKIILLDHAQDFTADPLSAESLSGIDVIVAAGSTGFMAAPEADGPFNLLREGDSSGVEYPTAREDADGNTVLVVNSDQLYTYVGNLIVNFDADGNVVGWDDRSGPVATTVEAIEALSEVVGEDLVPSDEIQEIYDSLQATELIGEQFQIIGTTTDELNGQRADVRGRETNLGRVAAESTLWWANNTFEDGVDIALKNGGGIRATILGPNVTVLTVGTALAFNNTMAVIELDAAQLIATVENSVSRVPAADGRFPQIAGMTMEYDASMPGIEAEASVDTPSRVRSLVVTRADGSEDVVIADGEAQGDLSRTFTLVTNSFLVTGGDGYESFAAAAEERGVEDPGIGERQILTDYIIEALGGEISLSDPTPEPNVVRLDEGE